MKFDEHGDGLGRYNIYNYRQVRSRRVPMPTIDSALDAAAAPIDNNNTDAAGEPKMMIDDAALSSNAQTNDNIATSGMPLQADSTIVEFEYSSIGRWTEDDYVLHLDDIQFTGGEHLVPESFCSRPCELGQAKIMRAGDHCCWICKTCAPYEFLPDEFSCQDCGIGRWPVANKTSCFDLPQKYLRWDSVYSLISLSIAILGLVLTTFVSIIFIKYLDTPVVKASGRELSFILLAGIAFCHSSTFVLLSKPTFFVCGSQRFLVSTLGIACIISIIAKLTHPTGQLWLLAHVRVAAGQDKPHIAHIQLRAQVRQTSQLHQSKVADAHHEHSRCHTGELSNA